MTETAGTPQGGMRLYLEGLVRRIEDAMNRPRQEWFSIADTAKMTGLSQKHVRRALKAGDLLYSDMGMGNSKKPTYRIRLKDIETWMDSCRPRRGPVRTETKALVDEFFPKARKKQRDTAA